jgi:hypothetical protein
MKLRKVGKRVGSFMLAVLITLTSVLSGVSPSVETVQADSNDRRAALIHYASGMNAEDLNTDGDLANITLEELQVIGIFLSNFYKPFQTCVNATDSDINTKLEEEEVQCLVDIGFDEEIAQYLVKAVKKASSSTSLNDENRLKIKVKYYDSSGAVKSSAEESATYSSFVNGIVQGGILYLDEDDPVIDFGIGSESTTKVYGGGYKNLVTNTPQSIPQSTLMMYSNLCEMMDMKNGYGTAAVYSIEAALGKRAVVELLESLDSNTIDKVTPKGQSLYLDCFGNIIADVGTAQVVVVPACMNPYVFQLQDENGNIHSVYNCANLQTMYCKSTIGSGLTKGFVYNTETENHFTEYMFKYDINGNKIKDDGDEGFYWRTTPGTTVHTFTTRDGTIKANSSLVKMFGYDSNDDDKVDEVDDLALGFSCAYAATGNKRNVTGTGYGLDGTDTTKVYFPRFGNDLTGKTMYEYANTISIYGVDWVSDVLVIDDVSLLGEFQSDVATATNDSDTTDETTEESTEENSEETTDTSMIDTFMDGIKSTLSDLVVKVNAKVGNNLTDDVEITSGNYINYHGTKIYTPVVDTYLKEGVNDIDTETALSIRKQANEAYKQILDDRVDWFLAEFKKNGYDFDKDMTLDELETKWDNLLYQSSDKYQYNFWSLFNEVDTRVCGEGESATTKIKNLIAGLVPDAQVNGATTEQDSTSTFNAASEKNVYETLTPEQTAEQVEKAQNAITNSSYTSEELQQDAFATDIGSVDDSGVTFTRTNIYKFDIKSYVAVSFESNKDDFYTGIASGGSAYAIYIFLAYVYGYANYKNGVYDSMGIPYQLNLGKLPQVEIGNIFDGLTIDNTDKLILENLSMANYIMSPTKGLDFIAEWVNNKVSYIIVSIHKRIMGSNLGNASTATTKYASFSGYVTMPELDDLSWTAYLLEQYDNLTVFLIIGMFIILMGYVIIARLTAFQGITHTILFAVCLSIIPAAINGAISVTNKFSDEVYGSKFMYWGLVQHEEYISEINEAIASGDYDDYLAVMFAQRAKDTSNTSANVSVRLKWMCPKKDNYMQKIKEQVENDTGSELFASIIGKMSNAAGVTAEEYTDENNAVYLYRSYTDIANYAKYSYLVNKSVTTASLDSLKTDGFGDFKSTYLAYVGNSSYNDPTAEVSGTLKDSETLGFNYAPVDKDKGIRFKALVSSVTLNNQVSRNSTVESFTSNANLNTYFGLPTSTFKSLSELRSSTPTADDVSLNAFAQMSESPFYYFSWNLYDQGMNADNDDATEGFKCLVLNESMSNAGTASSDTESTETDSTETTETTTESTGAEIGDSTNDGYFFNMVANSSVQATSAWGEMRDYMDMKTLFTVVIPYLKSCNDSVLAYDEAFGLKTYDGYSYDRNDEINYTSASKEDRLRYWQNVNTAQMFNMYTPWVDAMYDCDYAQETTIKYLGVTYKIEDPLDPQSYVNAEAQGGKSGTCRPMIFSVSEMKYYGLEEKDLTTVEQKILQVEKDSYTRLYTLMNYYTFHDSVINTAAAMLETFAFNEAFSQESIVKESYVLYPQSYELKNFSYDAFLRLILSQATGESIQASSSDGDIYTRVVQNSNMLCGVFLILNDVVSCWIVPLSKFMFLILIFIIALLMLIAAVAGVLEKGTVKKTLLNTMVKPLVLYLVYTIGHSLLVSLFTSEGNTEVTGATDTAITLGDPTMTIILMLVLNVVVVALYIKVLINLFKSIIKYAKAIGTDMVSMVGGLGAGIATKLANSPMSGLASAGEKMLSGGGALGALGGAADGAVGSVKNGGKAGKGSNKIKTANFKNGNKKKAQDAAADKETAKSIDSKIDESAKKAEKGVDTAETKGKGKEGTETPKKQGKSEIIGSIDKEKLSADKEYRNKVYNQLYKNKCSVDELPPEVTKELTDKQKSQLNANSRKGKESNSKKKTREEVVQEKKEENKKKSSDMKEQLNQNSKQKSTTTPKTKTAKRKK